MGLTFVPNVNATNTEVGGEATETTLASINSKTNEFIEIARGNVAGKKAVRVLGKITASVNNALIDITDIGGVYVFPTAPIQMQVVSSSANDAAAGTGVRTIEIHYLDNLYEEQSITVTLNGVTPVLTVPTNILRINQVHSLTVGSGSVAAGAISVQAVGGAVTYSKIAAGINYARQLIYTVPAGKTLYITAFHGNSYAAAAGHTSEVSLRTTSSDDFQLLPGVFLFKETMSITDSGEFVAFTFPVKIPATADVKGSAISDGGAVNATCLAHLEGWLE